jgi:nucleotide-binding universal stress UspA family protein
MLAIRSILVPTDFSEGSAAAYHFAVALARDHGARLFVVHVKPPPTIVYGSGVVPPEPEDADAQLEKRLHTWEKVDPRVPTEFRLIEGDAIPELLDLAEETNCDLIVLGTHGRGGLKRLLMGSVAEQIVRRAPCPVLTVKMPDEAHHLQETAPLAEVPVAQLAE